MIQLPPGTLSLGRPHLGDHHHAMRKRRHPRGKTRLDRNQSQLASHVSKGSGVHFHQCSRCPQEMSLEAACPSPHAISMWMHGQKSTLASYLRHSVWSMGTGHKEHPSSEIPTERGGKRVQHFNKFGKHALALGSTPRPSPSPSSSPNMWYFCLSPS